MLKKVLIANRGEIACRIIRSCKNLNIPTVAIYSEADRHTPHVAMADEAFYIGPAAVSESYLKADKILELCLEHGVDAVHPGYGLLSENLHFAKACEDKGIKFVGPSPEQIDKFGLKHTARDLAEASNVPMLTGTGLLESADEALDKAEAIGYPVILKSVAGGGGIGMRVCEEPGILRAAYEQVEHLSMANFGQAGIYVEKFVSRARHIEVQIFGNGEGDVVTLGERDCSSQRRNQKVIEETPAPNISEALRDGLADAARRLASSINYRSAGTVEFLVNAETEELYFLEVNTRLQVEHGVTEEVTGVDLVEWMLLLAAGEDPTQGKESMPTSSHSIQVRIYAEDPRKDYQPSSGVLNEVIFPEGVRCDTWIERGTDVSPNYDPLLAKLIVKGSDRADAIARMLDALAKSSLCGIETNLEYLGKIVADATFGEGKMTTAFLKTFTYDTTAVDVIAPGTQTSIQDYPGRLGYWDIGVPPSGPMDSLAFRLANRLVGNEPGDAALEITLMGPTLKFNQHATLALTGAPITAELDGLPVHLWQAFTVEPGSVLKIGKATETGCRSYLAVAGGFNVPDYLGSKSTFAMGHFGGHAGRTLLPGDVLHLNEGATTCESHAKLEESLIPTYASEWEIRVTYGPHGAPDFFTEDDIDVFLGSTFEVHYNSARTGIRLIAPHKPKWARKDGGEAGLHPSNLHDTPYAIGAINFTGDMPIILGPDGPSLGGFVCPVTIIQADLWMIGQLRPGDKIRFTCVSQFAANELEAKQDAAIESMSTAPVTVSKPEYVKRGSCIAATLSEDENPMQVTYRPCGDKYLLIEYGPIVLDLNFRFRIYALMQWLHANPVPGLIDATPGVRSLQLHYDSRITPLDKLVATLVAAEKELPAIEDMVVPTRVIHLPMSWNNEITQEAVRKYEKSVRKDAPWCPSNIEFIRRINGLDSEEEVRKTVFDASYLVMGLGDVYLGAPAAVPVDPRHRLLTTKYNPARTWTAEGTVGIGGVYMCIYGMDSPGGYQLIGQTLPIWNRYLSTGPFEEGKPWLLRFFDQVRYYPVEEEALVEMRRDFHSGKFQIKVEQEDFSLRDYNQFLADNAESIATFKARQQKAFEEERDRWEAAGQSATVDSWDTSEPEEVTLPDGHEAVASHINGNVWKIVAKPGDKVEAGQTLVILEAMKMEISVQATLTGEVTQLFVEEGAAVKSGQQLLALAPT
ncbi:urea carboxylase [Cerasicoccus frondis]|uniref:urea carboxylase n=1 Tax=Cerasicoccus frondis TaxID=490090 RepID=UPI002852BBCC|nr:urea carboxylase [Cerasicoccus frondis]